MPSLLIPTYVRKQSLQLWSIDSCQIKVSADQYHVAISRASHVELIEVTCFCEVDRWPDDGFLVDRGLKS